MRDIEGLQDVLNRIGSKQNVYLTRLSAARKVLFVEGEDFGFIRWFARKIGLVHVAEGEGFTVVPLGGFSNASRIDDVAWGFEKVLRADIKLAVLLDRDYRCDEDVIKRIEDMSASASHVFILKRKEIENYLLCPRGIAVAANERKAVREPSRKGDVLTEEDVAKEIDRICDDLKIRAKANLDEYRIRYFDRSGMSRATILGQDAVLFEAQWQSFGGRISVVSGKQVLARVNEWLQREHEVAVSAASVIARMRQEDIPADLREVLHELEKFASAC